jgi:hypothetical protein
MLSREEKLTIEPAVTCKVWTMIHKRKPAGRVTLAHKCSLFATPDRPPYL